MVLNMDESSRLSLELSRAESTRRDNWYRLMQTEGNFVEGRDHREIDAPGIMRQLWVERLEKEDRYRLHGRVRLGYQLGYEGEAGDVEWVSELKPLEVNQIFAIATRKSLPVQKRDKDFQFSPPAVINEAEAILLQHISQAAEGKKQLKITENEEQVTWDEQEAVWLISENGWSQTQLLNLVAEAFEYDAVADKWEGRALPFREFESLINILSDPEIEQRIFDQEWRLDPVRDANERQALADWLRTLRKWKNTRGHLGWGEKLVQRRITQRRIVEQELHGMLQSVGLGTAECDIDAVDAMILGYEKTGTLRALEVEAALVSGIRDADRQLEPVWTQEWQKLQQRVEQELQALWARDAVNQWSRRQEGEGRLNQAVITIHEHGRFREVGININELYDYFKYPSNEKEWRRNHPKSPKFSEMRRSVSEYLSRYDNDGDWSHNSVMRELNSWLARLNIRGLTETRGTSRALGAIYEKARGDRWTDIMLPEWRRTMTRLEDSARDEWMSQQIIAVGRVMSDEMSRGGMVDQLRNADQILPDMNDVWRLWKRERARLLQRWARPSRAGLELFLFSRLTENQHLVNIGLENLRFDNEEHLEAISRQSKSLGYSLRRLRSLSDDLGMGLDPKVKDFLEQIANLGDVAERYAHEGTFSPVGAEWREKLERAAGT